MKLMKSQIVDCRMGDNVTIVEPVNLYGCELGDNVFVGPFVEIQKGVKIGANSRIQSHSFLCEGVTIAADVFVGHGVMFINDKRPGVFNHDFVPEPTSVGKGSSIGSNATILPCRIGEGATIGAGSVVTKDVEDGGTVAGNPARPMESEQ